MNITYFYEFAWNVNQAKFWYVVGQPIKEPKSSMKLNLHKAQDLKKVHRLKPRSQIEEAAHMGSPKTQATTRRSPT